MLYLFGGKSRKWALSSHSKTCLLQELVTFEEGEEEKNFNEEHRKAERYRGKGKTCTLQRLAFR